MAKLKVLEQINPGLSLTLMSNMLYKHRPLGGTIQSRMGHFHCHYRLCDLCLWMPETCSNIISSGLKVLLRIYFNKINAQLFSCIYSLQQHWVSHNSLVSLNNNTLRCFMLDVTFVACPPLTTCDTVHTADTVRR